MSSDTLALASLSLTHVFYVTTSLHRPSPPFKLDDKQLLTDYQDPSDPISYVCALLALVPQALCIIYVTLIYSSREIELILMFAGQMACELMNWILKRIIQEERPGRELFLLLLLLLAAALLSPHIYTFTKSTLTQIFLAG